MEVKALEMIFFNILEKKTSFSEFAVAHSVECQISYQWLLDERFITGKTLSHMLMTSGAYKFNCGCKVLPYLN